MLEFFDLWSYRNKKVAAFSRGIKQKLAIARAIVHRPPILFLNEPTANLDPEFSKEIRDLIRVLSQQEKCTILLSTHRLEDAERLCRRVLIIKEGRKIAVGTPEELCEKVAGPPLIQIGLKRVNRDIIKVIKDFNGVRKIKLLDSNLILTVDDFI